MTDRYVYYFRGLPGAATENTVSTRPATLDSIRGLGDPIMESQLVVDHTELDDDGFLRVRAGIYSRVLSDPTAQIVSLELRARSRDREASQLTGSTTGQDKYMLSLESRELRKQARSLSTQVTGISFRDRPEDGWFEGQPEFK